MDLDGLLDLEENFYAEGYELGVKDGETAGYNEGSVFAVEKGFEKFRELGRLYGKGIIWAKRLPGSHGLLQAAKTPNSVSESSENHAAHDGLHLPDLPPNPRLEKHLATFLSLVDPLTLVMENTEEAVAEFDERLKKATAKAKIIERMLGETGSTHQHEDSQAKSGHAKQAATSGNIEDIGPLPARMMLEA
ncbi:conserved hypothetical protein [Uncinocarpus reesii 1704]|uniref:Essential protein Yae1 N-terminal domain-containing protein n=1 Tax=Uncinocarpus reesii (strain UAMH 1704) TaxID=336963 RepID=C4JTD8_UNCRE|nr:uncharacterized protein UREG_05727 [Uncinocarpus reesii 1704]EEP80885.1 conserved hypothetical protein [Uncinocarpus reesii 1704]